MAGQKGPGSFPDAAKDGVLVCKIHGFESPVVGRQKFITGIVSGKNLLPFQRHIKIVEVIDGSALICRYEAEIGISLLQK